jgi:hypothetical protein
VRKNRDDDRQSDLFADHRPAKAAVQSAGGDRPKPPSPALPATPRIVPFPATARLSFIARHARRMSNLSPQAAVAHLELQLRIQADTMRRKGIASEAIEREIAGLATAIVNALSVQAKNKPPERA